MAEDLTGAKPHLRHVRAAGLLAGIGVLAVTLATPPPEGLGEDGWRTAGGAALMAIWWITEAVPVAATALVPLALFPLLGVAPLGKLASSYANPLIFLFLGGFLIALAMQGWALHRRIALAVLRLTGTSPGALVGGFMAATAFLSMWVSNTATAVMMLPIGLSVIALAHADETAEDGARFARSLLLGIAYSASIGGLATLIGTPPNALLAGFLAERLGRPVGFAQWMAVGLPVSLVMLALAWLILTRVLFRTGGDVVAGAQSALRAERQAAGPMSRAEVSVAIVFALTALAWIARPLFEDAAPMLSDAGIALIAALALFVIPSGDTARPRLLDWAATSELPWGVLILFGGGLALAAAVQESGLANWIAGGLGAVAAWPVVLIVALVTALIVFLTELTSNTATAATFLPLAAALALSLGVDPLLLVVPAALSASCAFMMPVATPPNAIIFASGRITVPQMARAGFLLNLAAIALVTLAAYTVVPWALGV